MLTKTMFMLAGVLIWYSFLSAGSGMDNIQSIFQQSGDFLMAKLAAGDLNSFKKQELVTLLAKLREKDRFVIGYSNFSFLNSDGNQFYFVYSGFEPDKSDTVILKGLKDKNFHQNLKKLFEKSRDLLLPKEYKGKKVTVGEIYVASDLFSTTGKKIYEMFFRFEKKDDEDYAGVKSFVVQMREDGSIIDINTTWAMDDVYVGPHLAYEQSDMTKKAGQLNNLHVKYYQPVYEIELSPQVAESAGPQSHVFTEVLGYFKDKKEAEKALVTGKEKAIANARSAAEEYYSDWTLTSVSVVRVNSRIEEHDVW